MRVRLTIFAISFFLLWSSLLTVNHYSSASKRHEIKISAQPAGNVIVPDENLIWKKSSFQPHTVLISLAKQKIGVGSNFSFTTYRQVVKAVKYYLLFRVLRN